MCSVFALLSLTSILHLQLWIVRGLFLYSLPQLIFIFCSFVCPFVLSLYLYFYPPPPINFIFVVNPDLSGSLILRFYPPTPPPDYYYGFVVQSILVCMCTSTPSLLLVLYLCNLVNLVCVDLVFAIRRPPPPPLLVFDLCSFVKLPSHEVCLHFYTLLELYHCLPGVEYVLFQYIVFNENFKSFFFI